MVRFDLLDEYGCVVFHRRRLPPESGRVTAPQRRTAPGTGSHHGVFHDGGMTNAGGRKYVTMPSTMRPSSRKTSVSAT